MENHLFILNGIVGLTYLIVGIIQYKFPPKKINSLYGYRTSSSMKNIERWNFAQLYSAIEIIKLGVVHIVLSGLFYLLNYQGLTTLIYGFVLLFLGIGYMLWKTETAIKNTFKHEKN